MNRWMMGLVALGVCAAARSASAQVSVYEAPAVVYVPAVAYSVPVVVTPSPVVTAYYPPAYVSRTSVSTPAVAQMVYNAPVAVPANIAVPVVGGGVVRQTVRGGPYNYTQTTRIYGPVAGPRYSRVHIHNGVFGTTVREVVR